MAIHLMAFFIFYATFQPSNATGLEKDPELWSSATDVCSSFFAIFPRFSKNKSLRNSFPISKGLNRSKGWRQFSGPRAMTHATHLHLTSICFTRGPQDKQNRYDGQEENDVIHRLPSSFSRTQGVAAIVCRAAHSMLRRWEWAHSIKQHKHCLNDWPLLSDRSHHTRDLRPSPD